MFEDRTLSYAALEAHSNQLAHHLRTLGVGPETVVGLCLERSPEMVIGLLGILKAGGAYLPLDPSYPAERLAFMLADAGAAVLVTQAPLLEVLPACGRPCALVCRLSTRCRLGRHRSRSRAIRPTPPSTPPTPPTSSTHQDQPEHQKASSSPTRP